MDRESVTLRRSWSSCRLAPAPNQEPPAGEPRASVKGKRRRAGTKPGETEGILFALALAVEHRDGYTGGHCERLAFMSVAMGLAMRLDEGSLIALYQAGYLHDVGKVGVPDSILFKPERLNAEEWAVMRTHPARGEEICCHLTSLEPVLPVIRHHHERWNGSGYPDGLRGQEIPKLARVLQIADIYDALVSQRPYKPSYSPREALQIIRTETAQGWRDPEVVDAFVRIHDSLITKIEDCASTVEREHSAMRASLDNLERFLTLAQPAIS
jgi:putative two-component system response regulator